MTDDPESLAEAGSASDGREDRSERDGGDGRSESDGGDDSNRRPDRDRRDEPLGDLAAKVRERTGERAADERHRRSEREGPLADVASKVDERRRDRSDAFEAVEVGSLDGERLWEQLAADDAGEPTPTVPAEQVAEAGEFLDDDRDVRTIPKDTCHGCPHVADPPVLACTHEGTDILAMPDADHFRVADCPMVTDDEEVGGIAAESDGDSVEE